MKKLILASTSPYRAELLSRLDLSFEAVDSRIDEDGYKDKINDPLELARTLAYQKAKSVFNNSPNSFVIGGDQVSLIPAQESSNKEAAVLGKPGNFENAVNQIKKLQGRTHQLVTCVCVLGPEEFRDDIEDITSLTMRKLSPSEIESYVKKEEPYNCAGSYKIESLGIALFDKVQTNDSTAIVGLPLIELSKTLRKAGFKLP